MVQEIQREWADGVVHTNESGFWRDLWVARFTQKGGETATVDAVSNAADEDVDARFKDGLTNAIPIGHAAATSSVTGSALAADAAIRLPFAESVRQVVDEPAVPVQKVIIINYDNC